MDISLKAYGERHVLNSRITGNLANTYRKNKQYEKAFEFFIKTRDTLLLLFGPDHPRTERFMRKLQEERYASMLRRMEETVPGTA